MNTKTVKLSQVTINEANPRIIRDEKYRKLIDSLLAFPEMLNIRPIVVDNTMTILGGNMRARALYDIATMGEQEGLEPEDDDKYTKKLEAPKYEITGEKPEAEDLTDDTRYNELIGEIDAADIPEEDKEFLKKAAVRHIVFNYTKIAEYYAHASKEVQELMENSALVIIDYNKAIELGYVQLTKQILDQYNEEYGNEE